VIPGAVLGAGCGLAAGAASEARGWACGVAGLVLGLYLDARLAPFNDPSLVYFLTHLHQANLMLLLMVAIGALAGYWLGRATLAALGPRRRPSARGERETSA